LVEILGKDVKILKLFFCDSIHLSSLQVIDFLTTCKFIKELVKCQVKFNI